MGRCRQLLVLCWVCAWAYSVYAQQTPPSPDYFVEVSVDNSTPYVGQQITYTFRFYDAVNVAQPNYAPPDFEGFWQIADTEAKGRVQQIGSRQYMVSELTSALYPTRPGTITIEPARVLLPETVYRSEEQVVAEPISVRVIPLPDSPPEGFSGAVGEFVLSATLDRQTIPLGEPVTLRLAIQGTGNVEQLALPEPTVPDGWRVYSNSTRFGVERIEGLIIGEKVYEYLIFPDSVGSQMLPAITLSYFDPSENAYSSAITSPVVVDVLPSQNTVTQPDIASEQPVAVLALKPVSAFIPNQSSNSILLFIVWVLPPVVFGICAGYVFWQRNQRGKQTVRRQSQALQIAQRQLQTISRRMDSDSYLLVHETVTTYLRDKLSLSSIEKPDDWEALLAKTPVSASLKGELMKCIEQSIEGRYAPEAGLTTEVLSKRTARVLRAVDEGWGRR